MQMTELRDSETNLRASLNIDDEQAVRASPEEEDEEIEAIQDYTEIKTPNNEHESRPHTKSTNKGATGRV